MIKRIANIKCNHSKVLLDLCKLKFIRHEKIGYKLQCNGADCLAIYALRKRGLEIMGDKIGIGKESDIFYGKFKGEEVVLKFYRLGRTSFRTVKNNRNYHEGRKHCSWQYLSRLSAQKESEFMELFKNLSIPRLIDTNRHVVVMEYLSDYILLNDLKEIKDLDKTYNLLTDFIVKLYNMGYVHGDFNEFNVMVNEDSEIKVIDFPQCVTVKDRNAKEYLKRDYECVNVFFEKRFRYENRSEEIENLIKSLD